MTHSNVSRQRALLRYIQGYQLAHGGITPSMQECLAAIGVGSKSTITRLLERLEQRGQLRRLRGRQRAIEILRAPAIPSIDGAPLYAVPLAALEV